MKSLKITFISALLGLAFSASALLPAPLNVAIKGVKGESLGTATITGLVKGVKIGVDVHGLTPGVHAIHFHEKGVCQGPKFDSAGGHLATAGSKHGFDMEGGPHAGDMSNFIVGADGTAKVEIVNPNVSMGAGADSLIKAGGTALVIHEKGDDYKSQPAGAAGARVACGEIKAN